MDNVVVGNAGFIKDLNLATIFSLIYTKAPISRKELVNSTQYSAATITNHVKKLIEAGFVVETTKGSSRGGRKPVYLTVNPQRGYVLAIEIEVNRFKVLLFNLKRSIVKQTVVPISDKDPQVVINSVFAAVENILITAKVNKTKLLGIGLAVPGIIHKQLGLVDFAPNLGWENLPLVELFQNQYGLPVYLENEAKAAAIGEREISYPSVDNLVYVGINEGIGCGIISEGKLYYGVSGNAGEFGHMVIQSEGPRCHCGNTGCWETLASESAMLARISNAFKRQVSKGELPGLLAESPQAQQVVAEVGHYIGIGLANIVNGLSPEFIVIGGGITSWQEYLVEPIRSSLGTKALATLASRVTLEFGRLGELACVYGLSSLVLRENIPKLIHSTIA